MDDELGVYHYETTTPVSGIISGFTDIGDAKVWLEIEVLDTDDSIEAEDLVEGCKPYLYITDETTATEEADEVYGRVLVGKDAAKGSKDILCIQYIYYWVRLRSVR